MWLLRKGHVMTHTSLFVTALVTVDVTGWWWHTDLWSLISLMDSGNHADTRNHMETFWGAAVEGPTLRKAAALCHG